MFKSEQSFLVFESLCFHSFDTNVMLFFMQKQAESNIAFSHSIMNVSNIYTNIFRSPIFPLQILKKYQTYD